MTRHPNRRVASLFAGIGGFEAAFEHAGYSLALACEIDPAACAVLEDRFPNLQLHRDIRTLRDLPNRLHVLTAGFPCQDLSSVGPKNGIGGSRSSLVSHVFRLLARRPAEWVIFENVYFMLHLHKGRAIDEIVGGLERLGYRWAYRVLDSMAFGVPQRRKRVYFVASLHGDPRDVLLSTSYVPRALRPTLDAPIGFYWTEGTYATGLAANAVPPLKGGSTIGIPSPPAVLMPDGFVGTPDVRDAERLQGFPSGWTDAATEVARKTVRWKLVGNAISVPIAKWLASQIISPKKTYIAAADRALNKEEKWPPAAYNVGKGRFVSSVSDFPVRPRNSGLDSFLRHDLHALSFKATSGFIARARRGNLNYPRGFLEALERHAAIVSTDR